LSPVTATPDDVSPFGVFNLVGNACEFTRGYQRRNGSNMRMSKGGSYSSTGCMYGVASATFYYAFSVATKEDLGFRCVVTAQ
jgi:hypothetical protein